jgi:hypothetical protein
VQAQEAPRATPAPGKKPKEGNFRFWNMLPRTESELLLIKNGAGPDGEPLLTATPGNYYASYIKVPPARYSLKVVRPSDPQTALENFDVLVRSEVYVTFLAHLVNGKPKVEMVDDTFDAATATAGRLTIRQHFPDANVVVTTNTQVTSRNLAPGETQALDGLPLKSIELKMRATLPGGQTQTWATEVDFRTARHASLLVIPDPYGRFRPRVSIDGNPHPGAAAEAVAQ